MICRRSCLSSDGSPIKPSSAAKILPIIFAAKDYRKALRVLKKHPNNETALRKKKEVERFFRSEWFTVLSKLDPDLLIKRLNEEVEI